MGRSPKTAVVLGAGIAGMSCAAMLARHFRRVVVCERDPTWPIPDAPRASIPQARHPHLLLRRGEDILAGIFSGFRDRLQARGGVKLDWGPDVRWLHWGGWRHHATTGFESITASRGVLDAVVGELLGEVNGVEVRAGSRAQQLLLEGNVVRGVRVEGPAGEEELDCELVVDAMGRESPTQRWLTALGKEVPPETVVDAEFGYSTQFCRLTRPAQEGWRLMAIHPMPPMNTRMGFLVPIENDTWACTFAGFNRDYPPSDREGLLAFAASLPSMEIYHALRGAEPVSKVASYRNAPNRRRHFELLQNPIEGLVCVGDSACTFNPVYGQGMTVALLGVEILDELLRRRGVSRGLTRHYFKRLAAVTRIPWLMATNEDSRHPQTVNPNRGLASRVLMSLVDRLSSVAATDHAAFVAFLEMMHMTRSPAVALRPSLLFDVLTIGRERIEGPVEAAIAAKEAPPAVSLSASA